MPAAPAVKDVGVTEGLWEAVPMQSEGTNSKHKPAGAKLALFIGQRLLIIRRDAYAHIPFPGLWDFPGGGLEGDETPQAGVLRETLEEVGLTLTSADLTYARGYGRNWFFAAHRPDADEGLIRLGDEGQEWALASPETYLTHPQAIGFLQDRLRNYLSGGKGRP